MFRLHRNFAREPWLVAIQHGMTTGDGPLVVKSDAQLPMGLAEGVHYFAIVRDSDNFLLATSKANAINGIKVHLTTEGTGYHLVGPA